MTAPRSAGRSPGGPRPRTSYRCTECGGGSPAWVGRCPGCGSWNTLVEERVEQGSSGGSRRLRAVPTPSSPAVPIAEVDLTTFQPLPTGVQELDRVLGGGLVPGSVTLVGGEPGIGKSTLLLQALGGLAVRGTALYVTAEESLQQVRQRADRLGALRPRLLLTSETDLGAIVAHIEAVAPAVVVIDSIQTVFHPDLASAPGSVAQVRECAAALVAEAKARGVAVVLVGHVTKDGALAGPRVLEHVVDTVLTFDGERHHAVRVLRAVKHRFAGTGELGLMEMTGAGLVPVDDPSSLFLADRRAEVAGSVVVPLVDGHRAVLQEVQALVVPARGQAYPRRAAEGLDVNRLAVLLAVLRNHAGCDTSLAEVYTSAVGGVEIRDPGADLAVALAVASSLVDRALPPDLVVVGEVGLGGEVRQVQHAERRMAEAARMGFSRIVVPLLSPEPPPGITAHRVGNLRQALVLCEVGSRSPGPW